MSTTVDDLQQRHLHKNSTVRTQAPVVAQRRALTISPKKFFCTVAHRTCLCDITAMSNSVDELRARHNHCHLNGLLELLVLDHRDVTVKGHEEARHLVHCPQGHELVPERLQVHKAMTMHLGGSKSLQALEELPRWQKKRQEAVAIFTTDFAPTKALVLIVPSLLP